MLNPYKYRLANVHGTIENPEPTEGQIHFDTSEAHIKHWPFIFKEIEHVTMPRRDLTVAAKDIKKLTVHNAGVAYAYSQDGSLTLQYDSNLTDWFQFGT
ncbi:MAG: hypothetical protein SGARI_001424 [Bacillariaceae sp.]